LAPGNEQIQLKCPTQLRERSFTQINFIDVPNAVQSEISLVNTLDLKWLIKTFSSSYTYILGGDFNSYLNMNLREEHGWTYGASTVIGAGKYVSKLKSTSSVKNSVTDSAVIEFVKEIKIRTEKYLKNY
jgi:hypothetical protein